MTLKITLRPHHSADATPRVEIETRVSGVLLRHEPFTRGTAPPRRPSASKPPQSSDGEPIYLLRADEVALIRDAQRAPATDAENADDADDVETMSSARANE